MISKSLLFLIVLVSAVAIATSGVFRSSGQRKVGQESQESIKEKFKNRFPIADSSEPQLSDPQERTKRLKRSKKYNTDKVINVDPQMVESALIYNWPADFSPIPVSASNVIVVGTIAEAKAHLSEDKNSVYSEFLVMLNEVLKNDTGLSLEAGVSVTLERKGGRVRYPSGHISWFYVAGQGLPLPNAQYVLFLGTTDEERLFDILTGYQIIDGRIEPLDYSPGVVHFERYSGADATAFLKQIRVSLASSQP